MEAADLVLMGDFSSIIQAIKLGRLVFQNLQKVISYLLPAGSWSEDWPVVLNVFFGVPLPLSSFLMIIICCFTDLACCLTLIFEKEEFDLLSLQPRNPKVDHLINKAIYGQSYLFIGMMETICAHSMFFLYMWKEAKIPIKDLFFAYEKFGDGFHGYTLDELNHFLAVGQCIYFVTLVILQWGNCSRSATSVFRSSRPTRSARNAATHISSSVPWPRSSSPSSLPRSRASRTSSVPLPFPSSTGLFPSLSRSASWPWTRSASCWSGLSPTASSPRSHGERAYERHELL